MSYNPDRFFLRGEYYSGEENILTQAKLILRTSLYTSLFSLSYLIVSLFIDFDPGVKLMIFNVAGFLLLPLLLRTKAPLALIGNLYVFIGWVAIALLTYYSGGIESPVFPWLLAPPNIALLIVNRKAAFAWAGLALVGIIYFGALAINNVRLEQQYDPAWHHWFVVATYIGLLLILLTIYFIFEKSRTQAQAKVEMQNNELQSTLSKLEATKEELYSQHQEVKSKNEEIAAQTDFLKQLVEGKDHIINILAHDLKSPLDSMEGLISLMKMEELTDSQKEYLSLMQSSIGKSRTLIDKVIGMGALEHLEQINLTRENLYSILIKVVNDFRKLAELKEIEIRIEVADKNAEAMVDSVYLNQVYENILSNAIKFSPPGKDIKVKLTTGSDAVRTEISDQGPGISQQEMDKLFDKFSKLSAQPTAGESSTGLGLSLVKRYIELMKGRVWCESSEGYGATFIVEIPLI